MSSVVDMPIDFSQFVVTVSDIPSDKHIPFDSIAIDAIFLLTFGRSFCSNELSFKIIEFIKNSQMMSTLIISE